MAGVNFASTFTIRLRPTFGGSSGTRLDRFLDTTSCGACHARSCNWLRYRAGMAISAWWSGSEDQRYWMEATDRDVLGEDLRAPITGNAGLPIWHYELVSHVQPGDVVFHWHATLMGKPALVGWSVATGPLRKELHTWIAHAGAGAGSQETAVPRPNWVMPLGGVHLFEKPIGGDELSAIRESILDLKPDQQAASTSFRYFPFTKYGTDRLRAAQAYATKFPRELVELLATQLGLDFDVDVAGTSAAGADGAGSVAASVSVGFTGGGQGFMRDTARKLAVERYAVERAIEFYLSIGATEVVTLGQPYDLKVMLAGEEVHVEVKGSTMESSKVFVTAGEVRHAGEFPLVELIVVDQVKWSVGPNDEILPFGGAMRRWPNWVIAKSSLSAIAYQHELPESNYSSIPLK